MSFYGRDSITDQRSSGAIDAPYRSYLLSGVHKARATGVFMKDDNQYMQINFNGQLMYARPCYAFGGRISMPSKEWLDKYKDQIFIWVIFEEGEMAHPVWLGWCFNEGKQTDINDFPRTSVFRTEKFLEVFNDAENAYSVEQLAENKQKFSIENDKIAVEAKRLQFTTHDQREDSQDTFKSESRTSTTIQANQSIVVDSAKIAIGSETASNPMVLGTELNSNLASLLTTLSAVLTQLQTFGSTQAAASASPPLTPLAVGFTTLATNMAQDITKLTEISGKLAKHLSTKTTVE